MLNQIITAYHTWGAKLAPALMMATAEFPRYLIPVPTASMIKHHARSTPADHQAVKPALLVDRDGAVLIHEIDRTPRTSTAPQAFAVGEMVEPGIRSVEEISRRSLTALATARFVVFQHFTDVGSPPFFWCEGTFGIGIPDLTSAGWLLPVDLHSSSHLVRLLDPRTGNVVTLAEFLGNGFSGPDGMDIEAKVMQDMGTAIGTAVEQLAFIQRGCSLNPASRGILVLPE